MGWTVDLMTGIAEFLDTRSIGVWDPDGATGNIAMDALPAEVDEGIGLTPYNLTPDHVLADVVQPVQFWLRGSSAYVKATADALFDVFEGVERLVFGGIHCPLVELNSDALMGIDDKGRYERAVNYWVHAMRPTASRPD